MDYTFLSLERRVSGFVLTLSRRCYGASFRLREFQHGLPGLVEWNEEKEDFDQPSAEEFERLNPPETEPDFAFSMVQHFAAGQTSDWVDESRVLLDVRTDMIYINVVRLYVLADELRATALLAHLYDLIGHSEGDNTCYLGDRLRPPEALFMAWTMLPEHDRLRDHLLGWTSRKMTQSGWAYVEEQLQKQLPEEDFEDFGDFRDALLRKILEQQFK
jgi:hypothetical protein